MKTAVCWVVRQRFKLTISKSNHPATHAAALIGAVIQLR